MNKATEAVRLDGVSKRYGVGARAVSALKDTNLVVPPGEFLSVMGPSGSGKSTLLNLIAGLDVASDGKVVLLGRDLSTLSDSSRSDLRLAHVGFVFQAFNLFPTFTAVQNVSWPLGFLGSGWREAQERALEALSDVGVAGTASDRLPAELSGGEQQRVAIARALVTQPQLLLADEPTGNLDSTTGQAILDLLLRLNSGRGLTIILVTHNVLAATYGHRTVELRDGRIVRETRADTKIARRTATGASD